MRRHHFLTLSHMRESQSEENVGPAEGLRERRRSSQISSSALAEVHRRLPQFFSGVVPGENNEDDSSEDSAEAEADSEEYEPGFLGRVTSYSRLMHAHTKSQLTSPSTGTLPAYSKTMHAFTRNQLQSHRSRSETSSPHIGAKLASMPSRMSTELSKSNFDEIPHVPSNTPERDVHGEKIEDISALDLPVGRRRSLTDPRVARDFAAVKERELVNVTAVVV